MDRPLCTTWMVPQEKQKNPASENFLGLLWERPANNENSDETWGNLDEKKESNQNEGGVVWVVSKLPGGLAWSST